MCMTNPKRNALVLVRDKWPVIRSVYSLMIALLPILANNAGIAGIGLGSCLLGLFAPYALVYFTSTKENKALDGVIVFLVYMILRFNGYTQTLLLQFVTLINLIAIAKGAANIKLIRRCLEVVAILGTFLLLIQYIGYYLFDIKINYLIEFLLQEEFKAKVAGAPGTLYRPAAFFLEPAHYTQYCAIALISSLFPEEGAKFSITKVLWIAAGCILTTSGMGIVLVVAAFAWFAFFYRRENGKRPLPLLLWVIVGVLMFAILMCIPFFRSSVLRIVGRVDNYNAISGRLGSWKDTIALMRGADLFFGYGADAEYEWYITGLMKIIYRYGLVALVLMCISLIRMMCKAKSHFVNYVALAYLGLMVISDLSTVYSIAFFFGICLMSCADKKQQESVLLLDWLLPENRVKLSVLMHALGQAVLYEVMRLIRYIVNGKWMRRRSKPKNAVLTWFQKIFSAAWWRTVWQEELEETKQVLQYCLRKDFWQAVIAAAGNHTKQFLTNIKAPAWWKAIPKRIGAQIREYIE